jgi:hypothetical protein
MARTAALIATITPADIIADVYMRDEDAPEGYDALYDYPQQFESLEWNMAHAITALLPDELVVRYVPGDGNDIATKWEALQGLDPATTKPMLGGLGDADTDRLGAAIAWVHDSQQVAQRINLDALTRDAIREARLVIDSGV